MGEQPAEAARFRAKLAGWERLTGVVWMVIGIIQCISIVGAIAGAWNIYVAISRFKLARAIGEGRPGIVQVYEDGLVSLVLMGIINLTLGGVFAAAWIGFDFFVRSQVMKNRGLLEQDCDRAVAAA